MSTHERVTSQEGLLVPLALCPAMNNQNLIGQFSDGPIIFPVEEPVAEN